MIEMWENDRLRMEWRDEEGSAGMHCQIRIGATERELYEELRESTAGFGGIGLSRGFQEELAGDVIEIFGDGCRVSGFDESGLARIKDRWRERAFLQNLKMIGAGDMAREAILRVVDELIVRSIMER
jgi:hypothetical protein